MTDFDDKDISEITWMYNRLIEQKEKENEVYSEKRKV